MRKLLKKFVTLSFIAGMILSANTQVSAASYSYTSGNYTMTFDDADGAISEQLRNRLAYTFNEVYPKMAAEYNPNAPKNIEVKMDRGYDGVAYAYGSNIVIASNYLNGNTADTDCFTHELMHLVQQYHYNAPGWLVEGVADYARYKYGLYNSEAKWSLPEFHSGMHYTQAYGTTARFLVWVERYINSNLVKELDVKLRDGSYTDNDWVRITGQTVDQLWNAYTANPSLTNPVTTANGDIYIYQDINYGGTSASLGEGNYTLSALNQRGFNNDALSSIKVPFGYKVTLYSDDNYSGASKIITSDTSRISSDWNDIVSSIKVEKAQYVIVNRHSGMALDVNGGNKADGTNVQQWGVNGTTAQKWYVTQNSDSSFVLTSVASGKALDVDGWSTKDGANVHTWTLGNNQGNQQWWITDLGDGYSSIINKNSGKALDVDGWSTTNGGNVHQYTYYGQANQQWQFILAN